MMTTATQQTPATFADMITQLPQRRDQHAPGSPLHEQWQALARNYAKNFFSDVSPTAVPFPPFGSLVFPYHAMGAVSSLNLFEIDELILFSFYWVNRGLYKKVADIGANIGLHTILLSKAGFKVRAYEPDPDHLVTLQKNIKQNACERVEVIPAAVSAQNGTTEFIQVLGNTTSSHIAGAKSKPYGKLNKITVKMVDIREVMKWADLLKIDAEGHEKDIILATTADDWQTTDALVEIGGQANAEAIWSHLHPMGVNIFAQKLNWAKVEESRDMPVHYREGLVFVTRKNLMPWG